jgi:hypothetical protein
VTLPKTGLSPIGILSPLRVNWFNAHFLCQSGLGLNTICNKVERVEQDLSETTLIK